MRIVQRLRALEVLSGLTEGSYEVSYGYDDLNRIETETVTGAIERVTTYGYDGEDNIATETISENGKTITKTYDYDPVTKNITKITVVTV